jgi:small subunit ribosomal protein S2
MEPYIWGFKNKVHLIDVSKTAQQLEKAARFLEGVCAEGKTVLWVGTKKSAQEVVKAVADQVGMPYVNHRWVGGTLSNHSQVKKSVTKLLHHEDIIERADQFPLYTKKDLSIFQKCVDRLLKSIGGIRHMTWPVAAVVLVDVSKERSALKEAAAMGIPVIGLVDTNSDPSLVDYVIPANDDAASSIKIILDYLGAAANAGKAKAAQEIKDQKAAQAATAQARVEELPTTPLNLEEDEEESASRRKRSAAGRGTRSDEAGDAAKRPAKPAPRAPVRRTPKPSGE